jgi:hypothetical protein
MRRAVVRAAALEVRMVGGGAGGAHGGWRRWAAALEVGVVASNLRHLERVRGKDFGARDLEMPGRNLMRGRNSFLRSRFHVVTTLETISSFFHLLSDE